MPEVSPSVLVIRLDAIGDALALTPALASLRRHALPFDIVLTDRNAGVFAHATARRTFVADFALRSSTAQNRAAIDRLGKRLRDNAYTHVIVATEDPGGYRLASAVGTHMRVGFADPWTKPFKALWTRRLLTHRLYRTARLHGDEHECETLFRLVAPLTGDSVPSRDARELRPLVLDVPPTADDRIALQLTDKWARLDIADRRRRNAVAHGGRASPLRVIAARDEAAYAEPIARRAGVPRRILRRSQPMENCSGGSAASCRSRFRRYSSRRDHRHAGGRGFSAAAGILTRKSRAGRRGRHRIASFSAEAGGRLRAAQLQPQLCA